MAYTKTTWVAGTTPWSVTNFNHLETQYDEAVSYVNARVPTGVIVMWHGLLSAIPSGWVLCDGTNSTPDLRDKFVVGAASGDNPGTTGGALSKTSAGHTHSFNNSAASSGGRLTTDPAYHTEIVSATVTISDIRPPFYAIAFIMKT